MKEATGELNMTLIVIVAVAAVMAAIIDFNKQTGKDVRVVSVTKVED